VQPFKVSINAKGGYCWHVYRKSVLVIDGKNKNTNEMFIGKNNNDDDMFTCKRNNNDGMIIGRMCQTDTKSLLGRHTREISRSSGEIEF